MSPNSDEARLQADLEQHRQQLHEAANEISDAVHEAADIEQRTRRSPARWLGAAFVFGLLLGLSD